MKMNLISYRTNSYGIVYGVYIGRDVNGTIYWNAVPEGDHAPSGGYADKQFINKVKKITI